MLNRDLPDGLMRLPEFELISPTLVLVDPFCTVFPRVARKNRTLLKRKYHSAEGENADCASPVKIKYHTAAG
jgi:hypothetical protein